MCRTLVGLLSGEDARRELWQARSEDASFPQRATTSTHLASTAVKEMSLADLAILFPLQTTPLMFVALLVSGVTDAFSARCMTLCAISAYAGRLRSI